MSDKLELVELTPYEFRLSGTRGKSLYPAIVWFKI